MPTLYRLIALIDGRWQGLHGHCSPIMNDVVVMQQDIANRRPDWETTISTIAIAGNVSSFEAKVVGAICDEPGLSARAIAKRILGAPSYTRAVLEKLADRKIVEKTKESIQCGLGFKWTWRLKEME